MSYCKQCGLTIALAEKKVTVILPGKEGQVLLHFRYRGDCYDQWMISRVRQFVTQTLAVKQVPPQLTWLHYTLYPKPP